MSYQNIIVMENRISKLNANAVRIFKISYHCGVSFLMRGEQKFTSELRHEVDKHLDEVLEKMIETFGIKETNRLLRLEGENNDLGGCLYLSRNGQGCGFYESACADIIKEADKLSEFSTIIGSHEIDFE